MSITQRFRNLWAISNLQKSILTSVTVSPNGLWLMSASQDKDMVFVDFPSGAVAGSVDLSSGSFHVTASVWRTDGCLYLGTSDGQAFQLDFNPTISRPISMRRLLKLQTDQKTSIRALAFDPLRHVIAVGCGNEVHIYSRSATHNPEGWNCIERIPGPCGGNQGIVTALCFFGQSLDDRRLFIGHAMAGFCVWRSPGVYNHTPKTINVSSIGGATISSDERFIAISSLDQSIVTYPLGPGGPILHEQREFPFHEQTEYSPIVPIALTSSNIIFKGTASGDVPVLDSMNGPMAPIQLGAKRIVRTLTTHGDKIVIGSSDVGDFHQGSRVECYSTGLAAGTQHDWTHPQHTLPHFRLTLGDILIMEKHTAAHKLQAYLGAIGGLWNILRGFLKMLHPHLIRRATIRALFLIWLSAIVLTIDPPNMSTSAREVRPNSKPGGRGSSTVVSYYQQPTRPTNPTLFYLLTYLCSFVLSRFMLWAMWVGICATVALGASFRWAIYAMCFVPRMLIFLSTEIPAFVSGTICDVLQELQIGNVCMVQD